MSQDSMKVNAITAIFQYLPSLKAICVVVVTWAWLWNRSVLELSSLTLCVYEGSVTLPRLMVRQG